MSLKIENGVPIVRRRALKTSKWVDFLDFCKIAEIGQSTVTTCATSDIYKAMKIAAIWLGRDFTASRVDGGTRIWRIR